MLSNHLYEYFLNKLTKTTGNHLEIGTFDGEGIRQLALQFPDKIFYVIDPFIEDGHTTKITHVEKNHVIQSIRDKAIKNLDLSNVILFEMTSKKFFDVCTDSELKNMNITTMSIDGSHWYEDVKNDIAGAMRIFKNCHGIIHFDDSKNVPGVAKAFNEFLAEYASNITFMDITHIEGDSHIVEGDF